MTTRRQVLWVALGLIALLAAVAPVGYYIAVRARGQHLYRLRPTSYW